MWCPVFDESTVYGVFADRDLYDLVVARERDGEALRRVLGSTNSPLRRRGDPCGRPRQVCGVAWTTGRDKPVPYDPCSLRVGARPPGWKTPMEQTRNPLNYMN